METTSHWFVYVLIISLFDKSPLDFVCLALINSLILPSSVQRKRPAEVKTSSAQRERDQRGELPTRALWGGARGGIVSYRRGEAGPVSVGTVALWAQIWCLHKGNRPVLYRRLSLVLWLIKFDISTKAISPGLNRRFSPVSVAYQIWYLHKGNQSWLIKVFTCFSVL